MYFSSLPPKNPRQTPPTVGYVYDSRMMGHSCISGHPEQPERIKRIFDAFRDAGLISKMKKITIREAERDEILMVHSETLWDKVIAIGGWYFCSISLIIDLINIHAYQR